MTPCSPGGSPVAIDVSAVAVVVGATVVIGAASSEVSPRSRWLRCCICSQPRPSRTSSTIWRAPATPAGNHWGGACRHAHASIAHRWTLLAEYATYASDVGLRIGTNVPSTGPTHHLGTGRPPAGHRAATPTMASVKVSTRGDYASRALLSLALHR